MPKADLCHRCLTPVPPKSQRCPNCGDRVTGLGVAPMIAGLGGVLAILFVIAIMLYSVRLQDIESGAAPTPSTGDAVTRPALGS